MANLCIKTPSSAILVLIFQLLVLRPRPSVHANLVALTNEEEPRGGREALRTIVEEGGQLWKRGDSLREGNTPEGRSFLKTLRVCAGKVKVIFLDIICLFLG